MGTKNKILIGMISDIILHKIRNLFNSKELYITKRKYNLIQVKHPQEFVYIKESNFQLILDNTIAKCEYSKDKSVMNFISYVDNRYILFGISNNSYYTYLSTMFYPSKKQLKNRRETMVFFSEKDKINFEEFIN